MVTQVFELHQGNSPVILGLPHTGTDVPDDIWNKLNPTGKVLADTDWHIHALYAGLLPGASTIRALLHRYVIDANRDPADVSLYPGQNTTSLVPETDFDGLPIWREGMAPDAAEIERRRLAFHAPYHAAFAAEVERIKSIHGTAVVFDCHSIRSLIPFLFDGKLPDLNIGTVGRTSCHPAIEQAALEVAQAAPGYTSVLNGRFKGGWTTRHYGRPQDGVHAIQLELAQDTHLAAEAPPFDLSPEKATRLRIHLGNMLARIEAVAYSLVKDTA
ncbi:MAG: N-formylglutamate deformylase [Candidatus Devosia phytovorans]|uniref:N-formylglutamate deformylase n=1 Tax=Candidatus Devosia phytovorans TaxID=3121372 RepID=A0AAJ6B3R0_9HYPH|nr:N-formylglutamate deformylase [Devosia sp.]WEK06698.1 MAG: N-formylglutamate deformylase [Devosia sp.]